MNVRLMLLFFPILAFVFSFHLRTEHNWLYWTEIGISCLGISSLYIRQPLVLLGLALPILPFFEYGTVTFFVLFFNFGLIIRKTKFRSVSDFSFLIITPLVFSLFVCLIRELDLYLYKNIYAFDGLVSLYTYLKQSYPVWYRAMYHFTSYANFLILISLLPKDVLEKDEFVKSLSLGVIFSCLFGFAQLLELHPWFSLNREVFWLHVKRYEGTFTDPNALGVMSGLLVPYFYYSRGKGLIVKIAGLLLASFCVFSETRTFWLAMFTWYIIENYKHPKRLALVLMPILFIVPKINEFFQSIPLLDRFDRLFQTLNVNTFVESLYSRLLMGEIALRMWKTALLLGVGLERFYVTQESIAKSAGLDLGDWRDNANNFYLQIASEQGLYGLLMISILIGFLYYSAIKTNSVLSNKLLIILGVVLITGPHLYFEEVKYFVALLLAGLVIEKPALSRKFKISVVFIGLIFLFLNLPSTKSILGFWPIEHSEDGAVAWTGYKAKLKLCNVSTKQTLSYRTYNLPMNLTIIQNKKKFDLPILNTEWQSFALDKSDKSELIFLPSKVWQPGEHDKRNLGILLKIPENLCN